VTKTAVAADDGDEEARRKEVLGQIRDLFGQLGEASPEDELRAEVAALRAEIRALRESPAGPTHRNCCGYHCCGHVHYYPYNYPLGGPWYNTVTTGAGNYSVSNVAAGGSTTMTYQIDV
jgi:hypothetical protein